MKSPRTAFYVCLTLLLFAAGIFAIVTPRRCEQRMAAELRRWGPRFVGRNVVWMLAVLLPGWVMLNAAIDRCRPELPRLGAETAYFDEWRDVCSVIAESEEIPKDARFLTPRMNASFKWYARRPDMGVWKEMPQDAESIVDWYDRVRIFRMIYWNGRWYRSPNLAYSLAYRKADGVRAWGEEYEFDYVLCESWPPVRGLDVVYANRRYTVYRLERVNK